MGMFGIFTKSAKTILDYQEMLQRLFYHAFNVGFYAAKQQALTNNITSGHNPLYQQDGIIGDAQLIEFQNATNKIIQQLKEMLGTEQMNMVNDYQASCATLGLYDFWLQCLNDTDSAAVVPSALSQIDLHEMQQGQAKICQEMRDKLFKRLTKIFS